MRNGRPTQLLLTLLSSKQGSVFVYRIWNIYNYYEKKQFNKVAREFVPEPINIEDYRVTSDYLDRKAT